MKGTKKKNIPNTEQTVSMATAKLTEDISDLTLRKDIALSTFRETANELNDINTELDCKMNELSDLASFIKEKQEVTSKLIQDNTAIRNRILEIIGE